jgi:hypothetical protein
MAYVKIKASEIKKLRINSRLRMTHRGEKIIGLIQYTYPIRLGDDKRKVIRTKKYTINLSVDDALIDHDFIFEIKKRLRPVNLTRKFKLTDFL